MKKLLIYSVLLIYTQSVFAQKVRNQFFAFHNIIRGDALYNTFDKQVEFVKSEGFDAIEINQIENFAEMKAAINKHQFKGAFFYVKLKLEPPFYDSGLEDCIKKLKGTNVIISPFIVSETKRYKPSTHDADTLATHLLQQIGDMAKKSDLEVAIYPHYSFYVERTDHTLALAKQVNRKNVGLTFNLCHWLATTNQQERMMLKPHLKELNPYLKMITISGANDVISQSKVIWDDYILPLGQGSFNTYELVRYIMKDLKFKKPIGVQCYNIKGDKVALVKNTISVWESYKNRLK
jgi:sugar phosphate isomerase/epimerase